MSVAKAYRTNLADVPLAQGLKKDDGWIDMQVQFLIDEKTAGAETSVVGWTVLKPDFLTWIIIIWDLGIKVLY